MNPSTSAAIHAPFPLLSSQASPRETSRASHLGGGSLSCLGSRRRVLSTAYVNVYHMLRNGKGFATCKTPAAKSKADLHPAHWRGFALRSSARIGYCAAHGQLAEWSKAHAWKVCRRETVSRVRIPHCPPLALAKAFSRCDCGRNFALFSRVMRVGLSTDPCVGRPGTGLSGPIFSGPDDCVILVNSWQETDFY